LDSNTGIILKGIFVFNGLALGTNFVAFTSFCFEEYGPNGFAYTFGTFTTFASVTFLILDQILYEYFFQTYKKQTKSYNVWYLKYDKWNQYIGYSFAILSLISLVLAYIGKSHWAERQETGVGAALAAAGDMLKKVDVKVPGF